MSAAIQLRDNALPENRSITWQKMGASSGILSPIIGFTCILAAVALDNGFSWTNNALSDLGIVSGIIGPVFDFGLIASGVLAFNFAVFGLFNYLGKTLVGKIGACVFAAGSLALVAIGVFNENFAPTHFLVSVSFFLLMPVALFKITVAFLLKHQAKMAAFTLLIGFGAALPWIMLFAFNYVPNVAIPEFVSGNIVSLWTIVLGTKMLNETNQI
jgi:hypothetical membrane protein